MEMEVEQLAIRDFLAKCMPLKYLPEEALNKLTMALEIRYVRRGHKLLESGTENHELFLIRVGGVEALQEDGELYGRFSEGEWFGQRSLMRSGVVELDIITLEDTLLYCLPEQYFFELMAEYPDVQGFFSDHKPVRLRRAMQEMRDPGDYSLLSLRLHELAHPVLAVSADLSIQEVAQQMSDQGTATALVLDHHALMGIVTDQDFRQRVVAVGGDISQPISGIMTRSPLLLPPDSTASEALLLMARRNIRHIPVVDNNKQQILGVVSATDLLRSQSQNPVYLIGDIHQAKSVGDLKDLSQHLPKALVSMVRSSLPAYDTGHAISSIGQAITRRLLKLAEDKLGEPPVPYSFIVAGSMARREQTARSDQDNGLILSDDYDPEQHHEYFSSLAHFICDGLDACGYVYCPGDVMATNPKWCQPVAVWRQYFDRWVNEPEPQALLYASIFFDLRSLHGDETLLAGIQQEVLERTREQSLFQASMAANAQMYQPPLGIFKGFVLEKNGANEKVLDMKKRGVAPVINLARVFALAAGSPALNTVDRLNAAAEADLLTTEGVSDLKDAFEFISTTRLKHQSMQIEAGQTADNFVPPDKLSSLERGYLKDAFSLVADMQSVMARRYRSHAF